MAQEVRSILFSSEDVRNAVIRLLQQRIRGFGPQQLDRVQVEAAGLDVRALVSFSKEIGATRVLDSHDLMAAMLMFCRATRIPLSNRAHKKLGVVEGSLVLVSKLDVGITRTPRVERGIVYYDAARRPAE